VDKAMLTRSARELAVNVTRRYGLLRSNQQPAPQPAVSPMAQTQAVPLTPTAVHQAGNGETAAMPPNLTSVPHPNPYAPPQPAQYPQEYPQQHPRHPRPPTVSGVA
jgi:hypothetical protein